MRRHAGALKSSPPSPGHRPNCCALSPGREPKQTRCAAHRPAHASYEARVRGGASIPCRWSALFRRESAERDRESQGFWALVPNLTVPGACPKGFFWPQRRGSADRIPLPRRLCANAPDWIRTSDLRFRRPGDRRLPERIAAQMQPECDRQPRLGESGSAEDPALPECPVKQATGHTTSLLRLATAVDDEVDRNSEPSQLLSQPSVLLTAPGKVRLDHEQVEVAVRPSLSMSTRAEEDDVRARRCRREPAPDLLDQVLVGHRHGLKTVVAFRDGLHCECPGNRGVRLFFRHAVTVPSHTDCGRGIDRRFRGDLAHCRASWSPKTDWYLNAKKRVKAERIGWDDGGDGQGH